MLSRPWIAVLFAVLVSAVGRAAFAADATDATNRTVITSKRLSFDYQSHFAVFEENVVVTDPTVKIRADKMTVAFEADNTPKWITAVGNVHIEQADKKATCQRAIYQVKTGRLDLTGNPVMKRGQDLFKGTVITVWRDQDKMEGQDVQLIFSSGNDDGVKALLKE